jgi:hypothetical protein
VANPVPHNLINKIERMLAHEVRRLDAKQAGDEALTGEDIDALQQLARTLMAIKKFKYERDRSNAKGSIGVLRSIKGMTEDELIGAAETFDEKDQED